MIPVPSDDPVAKVLIDYTVGCIDALAIANGATHNEIMMTKDGPCLVEVNCRVHGHSGALTVAAGGGRPGRVAHTSAPACAQARGCRSPTAARAASPRCTRTSTSL